MDSALKSLNIYIKSFTRLFVSHTSTEVATRTIFRRPQSTNHASSLFSIVSLLRLAADNNRRVANAVW